MIWCLVNFMPMMRCKKEVRPTRCGRIQFLFWFFNGRIDVLIYNMCVILTILVMDALSRGGSVNWKGLQGTGLAIHEIGSRSVVSQW